MYLGKRLGLWRLTKGRSRNTLCIWRWKNMSKGRMSRPKNWSISSSLNSDRLTTLLINWEKISTKAKGPTSIGAPKKWPQNSKNSIFPPKTSSWPSWTLTAGCLAFTSMKFRTISQKIGQEGMILFTSLTNFSQETTSMCLRWPGLMTTLWAPSTLSIPLLSQGFHSQCQIILSAIILWRGSAFSTLWNKPLQRITTSCKKYVGRHRARLRQCQFMCLSISWTLKQVKGTWLTYRLGFGKPRDIQECLMTFHTQ